MPQVNCPRCGRSITLRDAELLLLIECAGCDARFYPMMPVDGPLPSHPARGNEDRPSAPAPKPAADTVPEAPPAANPPRPKGRKPRKKKKQRDWVPAVVGISLSLVLLLAFGLGIFVLVKSEVFSSKPAPRPISPDGNAGAPPQPPAATPPAAAPPPAPPSAPEPSANPAPEAALPPPSGKTVDLGAPTKTKGR